jgi:hypothetical protein
MNRVLTVAGIVTLLIGLDVGVTSCGGDDRSAAPSKSREPTAARTTTAISKLRPGPRRNRQRTKSPKLTARDRVRIKRVIAQDPKLKAILGEHRYVLGKLGIWTTSAQVKLGAAAELHVKPPIDTVEADWPELIHNEKDCGSHREFSRYTVHGLRKLLILVKLHPGTIFTISPLKASSVVPPAGFKPTPPPPGCED